jgi:hypothetical protein
MLLIEKINRYRDGGTTGITCRMAVAWKNIDWLEARNNKDIEICVDRRFGQEPAFWFGYPGKEGSERIEDETVIDYIIKKVTEYKERQANHLDEFIEIRENIRNWRIDKTLKL